MSRRVFTGLGSVLIGAWLLALSGCATGGHTTLGTGYYGSGGYYGSRGYYGSNTWYDPHYTRRCCYGGRIVSPPGHYQARGYRPDVVRPPRYRYRSAGRVPSIPSKRRPKRRKPPRHR